VIVGDGSALTGAGVDAGRGVEEETSDDVEEVVKDIVMDGLGAWHRFLDDLLRGGETATTGNASGTGTGARAAIA
jgi:hypothetical protein